MLQHVLTSLIIAAVLSPFSYYAGLAAKRFGLPQLTGYLVSGIICGPYVLGILSTEAVTDLNVLEGACLGIIGLASGAELYLPELYKSKKQVILITAAVCASSWVICCSVLLWAGQHISTLPYLDRGHVVAVATLGATLMMTRSPASAIAVIKEVDAKGSFPSLVMAVVVLKDVLVIVAFALNVEIIPLAILRPVGMKGGLEPRHLLLPIISVIASMTAGVVGGLLLELYLSPRTQQLLFSRSPAVLVSRIRMAVVLVVSTTVFQVTRHVEAEPLLACVTMGMVLANRRHDRSEREQEELLAVIGQIMSVTNVAFFGLAGASLKLLALRDTTWIGLVVVGVRLWAIWCGSWAGCRLSGTPLEHRKRFWMSMVTQAGVAMGLARIAGTRFPDWGPHFQTLMMSIIIFNMLIGPPMFRTALLRVGADKRPAAVLSPRPRHHEIAMADLIGSNHDYLNHREHS